MQVGAPAAQTVRSAPAAADVASSRQAVRSSVWRTSGSMTSTLRSLSARIRAGTRRLSMRNFLPGSFRCGERRAKGNSNHGAVPPAKEPRRRPICFGRDLTPLSNRDSGAVPASRRTAAVRPRRSHIGGRDRIFQPLCTGSIPRPRGGLRYAVEWWGLARPTDVKNCALQRVVSMAASLPCFRQSDFHGIRFALQQATTVLFASSPDGVDSRTCALAGRSLLLLR